MQEEEMAFRILKMSFHLYIWQKIGDVSYPSQVWKAVEIIIFESMYSPTVGYKIIGDKSLNQMMSVKTFGRQRELC